MRDQAMVFVVDDEPSVREALTFFLESSGFAVKGFPSAQAFLEAFDPQSPGCLILDVRMPGMNGMELQEELTRRNIQIPIIFLTAHGDIPMAARAFKGGAVDFLEKPFNDRELLARIYEALAKDQSIRYEAEWEERIRGRYAELTHREREVMAKVVEGKSSKEIAAELDVSHRTIEVHRAHVMQKMGAHTLPELVTMAGVCGFEEEP